MMTAIKWVAVGAGAAFLSDKLKGSKLFGASPFLNQWGPYLAAGGAVYAAHKFTSVI
jgi:hypothetical protein